jgi:hypothetical protein
MHAYGGCLLTPACWTACRAFTCDAQQAAAKLRRAMGDTHGSTPDGADAHTVCGHHLVLPRRAGGLAAEPAHCFLLGRGRRSSPELRTSCCQRLTSPEPAPPHVPRSGGIIAGGVQDTYPFTVQMSCGRCCQVQTRLCGSLLLVACLLVAPCGQLSCR